MRRSFLGGLMAVVGLPNGQANENGKTEGKKPTFQFPPIPKWRPSFVQPLPTIIERMTYYTDDTRDLVLFANGTCVVLNDGLSDQDAADFALKTLSDIFNYHPDMDPKSMDDRNIMVTYNHPATNVVVRDIAQTHWTEIEERHMDGLATDEVLFTPLGQNKFNDFGKQALLGRAYMFMDAQSPKIVEIKRHS
ncbi:hypothetical protein [Sphingobium sp. WCS2017Hpa-17]|uniref:hypothetical protein n=1 Tax=Sphingobium sp. WCS2017Hpa-17 TaxID=3073638 RepID=UPI00288A0EDE|nr:hypothetical protein [Sphingobium sp. WCS2017Hpa-17]